MGRRARWGSERRPRYHHLSHTGNMCNTGLMVHDLDFAAEPGSLCLQMKKRQYAHVFCSAAVLDKVKHGSYGSVVEHCAETVLTSRPRTTECILTSRTENKTIHIRRSSFSPSSPLTPSLPYCIWHNVLMLICGAQLGPAPWRNTV